MKTSKKRIEEDSDQQSSNQTLDPFAVDFFGVKDLPPEDNEAVSKVSQKNLITQKLKLGDIEGLDWYKYLSTTTTSEALFSNQLLELPRYLNYKAIDCLINTFSKYTTLEKKNIEFEFKSVQETNLPETLAELTNKSSVVLTVKTASSENYAYIAFDRLFSSELIDIVLGGNSQKSETLRPLSAIEKTLIEFLAINILSDLSNDLDISQLSLLNVSDGVDYETQKNLRGAKITFDLTLGRLKGNLVVLSPVELMKSLETKQTSIFIQNTPAERYRKIGKIIKDLDTNVLLGNTIINANDIPFLENEDVILIENRSDFWSKKVKVLIGDGTNYYLNGKLKKSDAKEGLSDEVVFEVEEIISDKEIWAQPRREKMDIKNEKEQEKVANEEVQEKTVDEIVDIDTEDRESYETNVEGTPKEEKIDEEALASLENVMVNLRVNLGGRRMSLSEIQKIRVGQIIELGCRPNDPVEIVTENDNKPIAIGELLEIEGHLGVRLTKILV